MKKKSNTLSQQFVHRRLMPFLSSGHWNALSQGWANSGPQAKCCPPQRFQWPAEALRKIFKSEIFSNLSQ